MRQPALDASIPVLTEIIEAPQAAPAVKPPARALPAVDAEEIPSEAEIDTENLADTDADAHTQPDIDGWLNEEWNRLERKIGGRILHQVMERLETEIEERVQTVLAEVLQAAVATLSADIQRNLRGSLQEVISEAVKDEIHGMQTTQR